MGVVKLLIKSRADIEAQTSDEESPRYLADHHEPRRTEVFELLNDVLDIMLNMDVPNEEAIRLLEKHGNVQAVFVNVFHKQQTEQCAPEKPMDKTPENWNCPTC